MLCVWTLEKVQFSGCVYLVRMTLREKNSQLRFLFFDFLLFFLFFSTKVKLKTKVNEY